MKKVCVIGLGYVGLPLAELCLKRGYEVHGLEVDEAKAKRIAEDYPDMILNDDKAVSDSEVIIICVPTPVDKSKFPDLSFVKSSAGLVAEDLKHGQLVVIESTVNPGVTEEVVKPILEESGLTAGKDFFLAHCPERINPGDPKWHVGNIPRVVGALSEEGTKKAKEFYESILDAEVKAMSNVRTAEAVKIIENTFRDVNIAFVNELAKSLTRFGIDVVEVIKGASTKPFAFLAHYPGCGVGGHCISVDPYYLIEKAKTLGFDHKFLKLAREINNSMPHYTVGILIGALNKAKKSVNGSKIGILGVAYKGGVGDLRESPALEIIDDLRRKGAQLLIHDPCIPEMSNATAEEAINDTDAVMLLTAHKEFKDMDYSSASIVIDGRNFLDKEKISQDSVYIGIGR